jgi:ribonuclease J
VAYEKKHGIHVSGHASQDDIKTDHRLDTAEILRAGSGEYKHMKKGADWRWMGNKPENILLGEIGRVIELDRRRDQAVIRCRPAASWWDGLGVGRCGQRGAQDRKHLARTA